MSIINWAAIDTVLLDMDGTLLDLHYDHYFWTTHLPRRYATIKDQPLDEVQERLGQHVRALEGTLHWYCLEYWSRYLDIDIGILKREIKDKIQERPYVQDFLQFLRSQGKTVALVTNAHAIGLDIKLAETAIEQYFDHIISSHQFQYPKEEQAFWHALQSHMPFDPQRTLFIDDNVSVLNAAKEYGIVHTLGIHQPDSQIKRQLNGTPAISHFDELIA